MGLFSSSEKVDAKTILAYNYFLSFEYIPQAIFSWWNKKGLFETAYAMKVLEWLSLNISLSLNKQKLNLQIS